MFLLNRRRDPSFGEVVKIFPDRQDPERPITFLSSNRRSHGILGPEGPRSGTSLTSFTFTSVVGFRKRMIINKRTRDT